MSKVNEQKQVLEDQVVENQLSTVKEVEEVETIEKKQKVISVAKTVGKAALVAGVGLIGYLFGYKVGKNSNEYEAEDYEVIDNDNQD